jgi:Fe-S cluster assembly protein SufD
VTKPPAPAAAGPATTTGRDSLLALASASVAARRGEPAWLARLRREGLERFEAQSLPTVRDEAWKYTSLAPLSRATLSAPDPDRAASVTKKDLEPHLLHLHGGITLVFVDGRFAPGLSSGPMVGGDVHLGSLAAALRDHPELVEPSLGRLVGPASSPVAALATALFDDGAFVHLGHDACLVVPVDVLHVSTAGGGVVAPRTLVVAGPGTRATVLERHVSLAGGGAPRLSLPVTEVLVDRHAAVEHVAWQEEAETAWHLAALSARVDRDSRFTSHAVTLGAAIARNDTSVALEAEGGEATLWGLYVVLGERHADHHTRIDHRVPHGTSREAYKGVLGGKATGVFDGRVVVHPGASGTDSRQANHNLLLSREATVDSKPQLEIFHDDVKCAHGATVGRLDEDHVFYLRSRGLPEAAAREMLVRAFARDVADRVPVEALHARLEAWMDARLPSLVAAGRPS